MAAFERRGVAEVMAACHRSEHSARWIRRVGAGDTAGVRRYVEPCPASYANRPTEAEGADVALHIIRACAGSRPNAVSPAPTISIGQYVRFRFEGSELWWPEAFEDQVSLSWTGFPGVFLVTDSPQPSDLGAGRLDVVFQRGDAGAEPAAEPCCRHGPGEEGARQLFCAPPGFASWNGRTVRFDRR